MARLVYGVSGEGSGHSSRARVVLEHLLAAGHEVRVATYDRGLRNLADFAPVEASGLHIATVDNKVSVVRTFTENVANLSESVRGLRAVRERCFDDFAPDAVFTDFEPLTAYLARRHDLPLVSIDNQHRIRYMRLPDLPGLQKDQVVTKTVIRAMIPSPDAALVTTFWFGEPRNERTFLFPPLLRREVLELDPEPGEHLLVYFTKGFDRFLDTLRGFPRERFVVYGEHEPREEANLELRRFDKAGFLEDLRRAKGVIATAGFTLLTESLHLRKPMLALPMAGQFEQELNAFLLEHAGYGKNGGDGRSEAVAAFLYHLPEYRRALADYPVEGNGGLLAKVDELLADDLAALRELQRLRRE